MSRHAFLFARSVLIGFGHLPTVCGVSAYEAVNTRSSMKKLWKRAVEVPKSGPLPTTALQSIALWGLGFQGHGGFYDVRTTEDFDSPSSKPQCKTATWSKDAPHGFGNFLGFLNMNYTLMQRPQRCTPTLKWRSTARLNTVYASLCSDATSLERGKPCCSVEPAQKYYRGVVK